MPTATPNFKFNKPTVGGDSGVWGTTLNGAIDAIDTFLATTQLGNVKSAGWGAVGNAISDDHDAFANADSSAAAAGGVLYVPTGTFLIGSNLTLVSPVFIQPGAKIKPAAGVTITIKGPVTAGLIQSFDLSLGGAVSFAGNRSIHTYSPHWWGAVGDGATDNHNAFSQADIAAQTGSPNAPLTLPPATYFIGSNLTLASSLVLPPGAVIKVGAGVTLTLNGHITAGSYQIFDLSAGGTLVFGVARSYRAEWFGIVGDGATDDAPALNHMTASIPDYSIVRFGPKLAMAIKSTAWLVQARRGIDFIGEANAFPDGGGTSITWLGPLGLKGTDLATTAASPIVTSASGVFTADLVGQLFDCAAAFGGNGASAAKVLSVQSQTQLTLDRNATATVAGGAYFVAPAPVALHSCDNVRLINIAINIMSQSSTAIDGAYITATSKTLNLAGYAPLAANHVGKRCIVYGAGPGGGPLITTISAVVSNSQATLADAASTTIANTVLTSVFIGTTATDAPALINVDIDHTAVNGCPGTRNTVRDCLIYMAHALRATEFWGISVQKSAPAENNNQEYHLFEHNAYQGNGTRVQTGYNVGTTAGSNIVTNGANSFQSWHVGYRLRIPNAGPAGGIFDTTIIGYTSASQVTVKDNATATVSNQRALIGEGLNVGVVVGPSANAKAIRVRESDGLQNFRIGVWQRGGSTNLYDNSYTSNEVDFQRDSATEPTVMISDNTEASGQHLVDACTATLVMIAPRLFVGWEIMNGGYIKRTAGGGLLKIVGAHVDIDPTTESTAYLFDVGGSTGTLDIDGIEFGSNLRAFSTIFDPAGGGPEIWMRGVSSVSGLPGDSYHWINQAVNNVFEKTEVDGAASAPVHDVKLTSTQDFTQAVGDWPAVCRAIFESTANAADSGNLIACFRADFGQSTGAFDHFSVAGFAVKMPTDAAYNTQGESAYGLYVESPGAVTNLDDAYGVRIKALKSAGVQRGHGFYQDGANDDNSFAGPTTFGAKVTLDAGAVGVTPAGGIGYDTGAGGVVTQLTNKLTGVTLNAMTGQITCNAASVGSDVTVSFVLTNSSIGANDIVICKMIGGGTMGAYQIDAVPAAGSATIYINNHSTGPLAEAIVIQFVVIKGAIA